MVAAAALMSAEVHGVVWPCNVEAGHLYTRASRVCQLEFEAEAKNGSVCVPIASAPYEIPVCGREDKGLVGGLITA